MPSRFLFAALLALAALSAEAQPAPPPGIVPGGTGPEPPAIVIGAPLVSPPWSAALFIEETARFLGWKLPDRRFELRWVPVDAIEDEFRKGTLDLAILPSGPVSENGEKHYRPLASMASREAANPDRGSACAMVVRKESPYQRPADLKDAQTVTASKGSAPGFLACLAALEAAGIDPDRFAESQTRSLGPLKERQALQEMLESRADAAFVRAGLLEDIRAASGEDLAAKGLRVLEPPEPGHGDPSSDGLALLHSSRPYPGLTLLASSALDPELVRGILATILMKPADPWGQKWAAPANLSAMSAMTRPLRIGPYAYLRSWTLERLWREFWPGIAAALLALLALIAHSKRSDALVRRRTRQLTAAFAKQRRAETQAREKAARLETLERKAIVGQLSGIFAHEISSPVAAAQNLAHGLRQSIDATLEAEETEDPERLEAIESQLFLIEENIARAGGIVGKVRSYAKGRKAARELVDLEPLLKSAAARIRPPVHCEAKAVAPGPFIVSGDALELELVLWNLVKNGAEACRASTPALVRAELSRRGASIVLEVTDSGPELTDAALANIRASDRISTKTDGLGMGLGIVVSVVERHGGGIRFEKSKAGGLKVEVMLPAAEKGEEDGKAPGARG